MALVIDEVVGEVDAESPQTGESDQPEIVTAPPEPLEVKIRRFLKRGERLKCRLLAD